MAFYGKKFKKINFENVVELMDKLDVKEKTRQLLRQSESLSSFQDNGDGSLQYIVSLGDAEVISQKIIPGEEKDFKTPDGIDTKVKFTLEGENLNSVMTFPDGKILHLNRVFDGNTMTLYIWLDGDNLKASVTYQAV